MTAQGTTKQFFRVMGQICSAFDQELYHVHPIFQYSQFQRKGFVIPRPISNHYLIALWLIGRMPCVKQGTNRLYVTTFDIMGGTFE